MKHSLWSIHSFKPVEIFLCGLNLKKKKIYFLFNYICVGWKASMGAWSQRLLVPGAGVTGGYELTDMGARNWTLFLWEKKKHALLTTVSSSLSPLLWHFIINFVLCYCWPSAVSTRIFSLLRSSGSTLLFCLCLHWVLEYLYFQLWLWISLTLFLFLVKFHFIHFESML